MKPAKPSGASEAQLAHADALMRDGFLAEAAEAYARLVRRFPANARLLTALGTVHLRMGNLREGDRVLARSLQLAPHQPEALANRAIALVQFGRAAEAEALLRRALQLRPDHAEAHNSLGNVLRGMDRDDEARAHFEQALLARPGYAEAWNNLGTVLLRARELDAALGHFRRALALQPDYADALNNLGVGLSHSGRYDEALASLDRALQLRPSFVDAHHNRFIVLLAQMRVDEALAGYDRALALDPEHGDLQFNKSLVELLVGDYENGWKRYEWRWKRAASPAPRSFAQPLWLGETPIAGKTLLIHPEQGLGDYVQFCRYARLAAEQGARVVLEAPAPLVRLVRTMSGDFTVVKQGDPLPPFDCHCPVMSLALAFGTVVETIPGQVPYLFADDALRRAWRERLGAKIRPRVGLVWSGSTGHANDFNRSMALEMLAPVLALPLEFHALQKEIRPADARALRRFEQLRTHCDELGDFADTAALAAEMDLVVSVDTSAAHVAAALGQETWILLAFAPDFRWLVGRPHTPWYPGAALIRQPAIGNWGAVVAQLGARLRVRFG